MDEESADPAKAACCGVAKRDTTPSQPAAIVAPTMPAPPPARLVALAGGSFVMGSDDDLIPLDGEGPARNTRVRPFRIDPFAVTGEWFGAFIAATGYVTEAERFGWSYVFHANVPKHIPEAGRVQGTPWWRRVDGARWDAPEGPGTNIDARRDHPVVHVSWNDAQAFATWAGGRLPTEAEWEFAARGGLHQKRFPWGDEEPTDIDNARCNIWQGAFPHRNTMIDGYGATAPVDAFSPNAFGLYNLVGNSWEWTADPFRIRSLKRALKERNAREAQDQGKVLKGGSYLCHRSYCYRYRVAARISNTPDTTTAHIGFRLVFD